MSPCNPFVRAALLAALLLAAASCEKSSRVMAPGAPEPVPPVTPPGAAQGESILSLATSDSAVIAATTIGIVRTVDNGLSWSLVDPARPGLIGSLFAAIGDHVFAASFDGVAISDDAGLTWRHATFTPPGGWIQRLAVSGTTVLGAGSFNGIERSTDLGGHWELVSSGPTGSVRSLVTDDSRVVVVADDGSFRSDDGGATWTSMSNPPEAPVSMVPQGGRLYAGSLHASVFVSSDDGATWSRTAADLPRGDDEYGPYLWRLTAIGSDLYAFTSRGLFRTSDRGASWSLIPLFPRNDSPYDLIAHEGSLYAGMGLGGVLRSDDQGASWMKAHATGGGPVVVTVADPK